MIYSVVILLFSVVLSLYRRDTGLMAAAILQPMLNSFIAFDTISVGFLLNLFFCFEYRKEIISFFKAPHLFRTIYITYAVLVLFSTIIATSKHFFMAFQDILSFVVVPLCASVCFQNRENLNKFVKILLICVICCIAYVGFEIVSNSNPIVESAVSQNLFAGTLMNSERFGIKQIQCLFAYHETAGCFFWMMAIFLMWIVLFSKYVDVSKNFILVVIIFACICCFFTGSRSSIVSLCLGLVPFAIYRKKYIVLLPLAIIICGFAAPEYFVDIYNSIIGSDSSDIGGSTISMRSRQLELSVYYMLSSPTGGIFGHGLGYTDEVLLGKVSGLAGAESLWFRVMIDEGLIGVAFMIWVFVYSLKLSYSVNKFLIFIVLAFLCAKTVAVVPAVEVSWMFVFILYFKYRKVYEHHVLIAQRRYIILHRQ